MHVHSSDLRLLRDTRFESSNRPEIVRLLTSGMFWNDPHIVNLDALLDAALEDRTTRVKQIANSDEDRLFLQSIAAGRNAIKSASVGLNHYRIGHEFDFLTREESEWNLLRVVNYMKLNSTRPTKRLAVLTSIRNEGISILEWVAHYRVLGADTIIVYTNGNDDGSDELLASLSRSGLITVVQNDTLLTHVGGAQRKAFEHAFHFLPDLWEHEWVFFIDADEFLVVEDGGSVGSLVDMIESDVLNPRSSGMCLNWKWFGSGAEFHREPRLMTEKYIHSRPSRLVKTIARIRDVTGLHTAHCPRVLADSYFTDASLSRLDGPQVEIEPTYNAGQINHYWNKSFEEFLVKSMRFNWEREPRQFFEWGNMAQGDYDPLPVGWTDRVRADLERLLELPGVRQQSEAVEENFKGMIISLDREKNIKQMYEDARQATAHPSSKSPHGI